MDLPKLEKFEIKYGAEEFGKRNKIYYWDFSRFGRKFELKFREPL
jgi:hypothetical protein